MRLIVIPNSMSLSLIKYLVLYRFSSVMHLIMALPSNTLCRVKRYISVGFEGKCCVDFILFIRNILSNQSTSSSTSIDILFH